MKITGIQDAKNYGTHQPIKMNDMIRDNGDDGIPADKASNLSGTIQFGKFKSNSDVKKPPAPPPRPLNDFDNIAII